MINKIGLPLRGRLICLITSMITDRIGRHEVLLPINHIYNKIREIKRRKHTGEGIDNSFTCEIGKRKKRTFRARRLTRTLQFLRHDAYIVQLHCPINAQIMAGDSQSDSRWLRALALLQLLFSNCDKKFLFYPRK